MTGKRGRPPRGIEQAREFGRLVERERKRGATLEQAMMNIRRRDSCWGSRSKMLRLWAEWKADQLPAQLRERKRLLAGLIRHHRAHAERDRAVWAYLRKKVRDLNC